MTENTIDKLKGQHCKILIDEPGKKKSSVVFGIVKDVDHKKGFLILESSDGLGIIDINSIVAIKPTRKKK